MKTIFRYLFIAILFIQLYSCINDPHVSCHDLPKPAQQFIDTYFPDIEIDKVERYDHKYELLLSNNFTLTFTEQGDWLEVNGNLRALPSPLQRDIIPITLRNYIASQYPEADIAAIERIDNQYRITLTILPLTRLTFDSNGRIID